MYYPTKYFLCNYAFVYAPPPRFLASDFCSLNPTMLLI